MINIYLGSLVRHGITALAGALISMGVLSGDQSHGFVDANSQVVTGALLYAVGQGLSLLGKKEKK